jgi:hypothetical protein
VRVAGWLSAALLVPIPAHAQDDAKDASGGQLIKLIDNPIADVINVPIENNFGFGAGQNRAFTDTFNLKPVIPFALSDDWLLVTRTIAPVTYRESQRPGASDAFGMGDVEASFFLSPAKVPEDLDWGVGPVVHVPTATVGQLGGNQWGAGPTGAVVWQQNGWTVAMLGDHVWSFGSHADLSNTEIDPSVGESWKSGFGWKVEANSNYNWIAKTWSIPLKAGVTQLVHIGDQPVSLGFDAMYYASRSSTDPQWALRLTLKFVFQR